MLKEKDTIKIEKIARTTLYNKANPSVTVRAMRKYMYGIDDAEYHTMLVSQVGLCYLCDKQFDPFKEPCVDHCHKTGKVRSLLCRNCNAGLGLFKENATTFLRAIEYVMDNMIMIQSDIANEVAASLAIGQLAKYNHPELGSFAEYPILEINSYYIVVQTETNKFLVPVSWLHEYQRIEQMRMPMDAVPQSPGAARRGRKSNAQKVAEAAGVEASAAMPLPQGASVGQPDLRCDLPALSWPGWRAY